MAQLRTGTCSWKYDSWKGLVYSEVENPNYLKKEFFEFMREYNLGIVLLQGYYMPPVTEVYEKFSEYFNTTTVLRLHGPDRSGIEKITGATGITLYSPKIVSYPV